MEGEVFFKTLANQLMENLLRNSYFDTTVQNGEVQGMPGCVEHTGIVTQLIREARENRGDLLVIWLDLANAPHKLVTTAPAIEESSANKRLLQDSGFAQTKSLV